MYFVSTDNITKVDKLDRHDFIKFVENLIVNSDNYKRNNDSDAYVMALNSAWGTGKSYFLDLFIQDIKENEKINVVKYNAWENDYCDNAFNPLMYDILNADCLKFSTETDADIQNAKNLLKSAFNVGKVFTKGLVNEAIKNKTGVDVEKALDEAIKATKDFKSFMIREIPNLNELNEQRDAFNELKTYLSNATEWMKENNSKLVVIIDELDRCKPTFAIQTLEIVKHIFDIKNIVFLFAVDIEQLSHSISSVYGQGFDSVGYLCRFFDYIAKMPAPNIEKYIAVEISNMEGLDITPYYSYKKSMQSISMQDDISEFIALLYSDFDLSLRDLDTIIKNYKIMVDNFLGQYKFSEAHGLYLFYLTIKYKQPRLFDDIFIYKGNPEVVGNKVNEMRKLKMAAIPSVKESFMKICENNSLAETSSWYLCDQYCESMRGNSFKVTNNPNPQEYTNYSNVLFKQDLDKWKTIKDYSFKEYIHKQLENYNFINIETKEEE